MVSAMTSAERKRLLSQTEVAQALGVSADTVRRCGDMPADERKPWIITHRLVPVATTNGGRTLLFDPELVASLRRLLGSSSERAA